MDGTEGARFATVSGENIAILLSNKGSLNTTKAAVGVLQGYLGSKWTFFH